MHSYRWGCLGAVVLALNLGGCAPSAILGKTIVMYPGERRPIAEVSVVECDDRSSAVILEVDGRPKSFVNCAKIGSLSFGAASAKVHLLPGKHSLSLRFWEESYNYSTNPPRKEYLYSPKARSFQFLLEPGKTYYLRANRAGSGWTAKLEKREATAGPR
jgi:hypothetical protein